MPEYCTGGTDEYRLLAPNSPFHLTRGGRFGPLRRYRTKADAQQAAKSLSVKMGMPIKAVHVVYT